MASEEIKGFSVTPARVGYLLSLITLLTLFVGAVTWFTDLKYQVRSNADYVVEDKQVTKEILGEIKVITRKVDELTFIVKNMDAKNQQAFDAPKIQ
jgi:hypothetical protein